MHDYVLPFNFDNFFLLLFSLLFIFFRLCFSYSMENTSFKSTWVLLASCDTLLFDHEGLALNEFLVAGVRLSRVQLFGVLWGVC